MRKEYAEISSQGREFLPGCPRIRVSRQQITRLLHRYPHIDLTFITEIWENMNRKEFGFTESWMSYSSSLSGREWKLTAYYFATGQLAYDKKLIFKKFSMLKVDKAFAFFRNPAQVHGKILLMN